MLTLHQAKIKELQSRVADPHHFNADPGPAVYFNANPDPGFHFNADPDLDPAPLQNDGHLTTGL